MKEEIKKEFSAKWTQDESTGFLKPLCHVEDVEEVIDTAWQAGFEAGVKQGHEAYG